MSAAISLDWNRLASYAASPFLRGPEPRRVRLLHRRDPDVHEAIADVVASAARSTVATRDGFDDDEAPNLLLQKSVDPNIAFILIPRRA